MSTKEEDLARMLRNSEEKLRKTVEENHNLRIEKRAKELWKGKDKAQDKMPMKMYLLAGAIGIGLYGAVLGGEYVVKNTDILGSVSSLFQSTVAIPQKEYSPEDFVKIVNVKPYYLLAIRHDGKYELRTGGKAAWRYNNPGKLVYGSHSKKMGSLGSDGKLSIFPSYQDGRRALETMLFESNDFDYKNMTIKEAINVFVPKSKWHNPVKYAAAVTKASGASLNTNMSDLTPEQRKNFLNEIETQEGYIHGMTNLFNDQSDYEDRGW